MTEGKEMRHNRFFFFPFCLCVCLRVCVKLCNRLMPQFPMLGYENVVITMKKLSYTRNQDFSDHFSVMQSKSKV